MKKSKIYTKTGDNGETGLVSGNRASKSDLRIDLYGEVDELNSRIGFVGSLLSGKHSQEEHFLQLIQSALFDLGSNIACEFENRPKYQLPQLNQKVMDDLEAEIDRMDAGLEPLKNFILPGGTLASSAIHLARTGSRKVERLLIHYQDETKEELPDFCLPFMNRLSDYFFVLARYINKAERGKEVAWKPRS